MESALREFLADPAEQVHAAAPGSRQRKRAVLLGVGAVVTIVAAIVAAIVSWQHRPLRATARLCRVVTGGTPIAASDDPAWPLDGLGWGRPRLLDATDRLRISDQLVIAAFAEFPLSESSIKNPVPAGEHWLPGPNPGGAQAAWGIDSLGGTEHFLVFIAPDRVDWLQAAWDSCPKPKSVSGSGITAFRDVLRGAGIVATAAPADDVGDNARLIDQLKAAARSLERDDGVEMIDLVAIDADVASTFAIALLSSVDCRGAVISTDFAPAWTFAFSVVIATRWYSASQRASSSFACA